MATTDLSAKIREVYDLERNEDGLQLKATKEAEYSQEVAINTVVRVIE